MKRIVAKAGGDIDTSRDYAYTDWTALRMFATQLVDQSGTTSDSLAGVSQSSRASEVGG